MQKMKQICANSAASCDFDLWFFQTHWRGEQPKQLLEMFGFPLANLKGY
jgi:hypothetical protein